MPVSIPGKLTAEKSARTGSAYDVTAIDRRPPETKAQSEFSDRRRAEFADGAVSGDVIED